MCCSVGFVSVLKRDYGSVGGTLNHESDDAAQVSAVPPLLPVTQVFCFR